MNCAFDKEKLSAFYDGELAAGEKAEVERHIASCSECLRDLGELKSAALLIKELPRLRAPRSIAEGVSRDIQAAGKVQSIARFRRVLLWTSAAAAGLFVLVNVMYLRGERSPAPVTMSAPALARSLAKSDPAAAPSETPAEQNRYADSRRELEGGLAQGNAGRRQDELRKSVNEEEKRGAAKPVEEAKRLDAAKERAEAPAAPESPKPSAVAKAELPLAPKPTAAPAPPAAAPMPQAKTAAPQPLADAAKPTPAPVVEKAAKEVETDRSGDLKSKVAAAGTPADLPPVQFNVVTTQLAKARPRIEDSLKKMNVAVPPPASQPMKAPRNREAENTIVLELTDAQLLKLRDELEKPGDARMVTASSVEPVLPGFKAGGIFGKKEAVGGAGAPGKAPAAKDKDKDGKDEDPAALKAAEGPPAPRRKVTLHLVESTKLPPAEGDPVPPQKN